MSGNAIRFYLDGNEYDSPQNWQEVVVEISLDHSSQIVAIDYTTELIWHGSAFTYLHNKVLNDNCGLVNVRVDVMSDNDIHTINGVVFLSNMTFNETKAIATGKIEDDAYSARIQNNKSTEVFLGSPTSKNGVGISNVFVSRSVFKPSDGVYYADYVSGITPFRAFEYLIDWMTDKTVELKSDFFQTGAGANYLITTADNLQNLGNNGTPPTFSFKQLFDTMRALFNIGMGFQRLPDAFGELKPTVVIEPLDFFRNTSNQVIIDDVHTTELSFVQSLLYTQIEIGGEITPPYRCDSGNTLCNASNNVLWFGFDKEYYPMTGTCNRDMNLNLSIDSKFVIDTNTIENVLEYDSQSEDKKAFIIEIFDDSLLASVSDPLDVGQRWYNGSLTNKNIVYRYEQYLQSAITVYGIDTAINQFNVGIYPSSCAVYVPVQTPAWSTPVQIIFPDDSTGSFFDQNDKYDTTTGIYQPIDEGVYQFNINGTWQSLNPPTVAGNIITGQFQMEQYNNSGVLLTTHTVAIPQAVTNFSATNFSVDSGLISMDANDYLIVKLRTKQNLPVGTHPAEVCFGPIEWKTIFVRAVVEQGQTNTGTKATPKVTATNAHLPMDTIFSYLNDTTKTIRLSNQYIGNRDGHVERVSVNLYTGQSEISINHG